MIATSSNQLPFVLFQVKEVIYAVNSENVREIVMLPKVVGIPSLPPEIRGVINLRGKVLHVVDLRVKLGLPSAKAELDGLLQLLKDREQDHHNWLTELDACVREQRPFKLARDPHACKFGLWYDNYQTDNSLLKMVLQKMNQPHQLIHASAGEVLRLAEQGVVQGALEMLSERRNHELAELTKLFGEASLILREQQRELAVVLCYGEKRFAISIDRMEAVERIPEGNIECLAAAMAGQNGKAPWRVGKRNKTNQTILLLDDAFLLSTVAANPIPSALAAMN